MLTGFFQFSARILWLDYEKKIIALSARREVIEMVRSLRFPKE